jgi:asparagine synthase (glutamine-hydrolysing)
MHLYKEHDTGLCNMLDGMFSFVLLDTSTTPSRLVAARDPIGITTLYMGYHSSSPDTLFFSSELKSIHEECDNLIAFPPGHFYDSRTKQIERYYFPTWWDSDKGLVPHNEVDYVLLRETLEKAVRKRLMSEVPYGVLLSGGLDSSLIASIAARETDKLADEQEKLRKERQHAIAEGREPGEWNEQGPESTTDPFTACRSPCGVNCVLTHRSEGEAPLASWPRLHSFAIGLPGAPDLIAARKAADFLGTVHHEYTFTVQEGLDAIPEVIYHLETYDVTTVRASTPMYLLSRKIKAMGVKMVLSGEGSDEIFGGEYHAAALSIQTTFCNVAKYSRLPLLPRRAERKGLPRGMRQASQEPPHRRLSPCEQVSERAWTRAPNRGTSEDSSVLMRLLQVDNGVGSRGARAIPRQVVPRGGDEH